MAAKQLVFSEDARRKLKNGMNTVANAVSATLGPKGRNVAVDRKFGSPTITHDGVSVAKEIELEDPFENMGAQLLKEAAQKTNDIAGDGTTTSTVLAHAIVNEGLKALEAGMANLQRHIQNIQKFGLPAVVSINRFSADTDAEIALVKEKCKALGVEALMADHWAMGGEGAADVAKAVVKLCDEGKANLKLLYPDDMPLFEKIRTIAKEIYRADDATADKSVKDQLKQWEEMGFGKLPVCIAKTQYSFSTNPDAKGAPTGFNIPVREVRLSAGAEFIVAICGEIMTMPGLPKVPSADSINVNEQGRIVGLF